MKKRFLDYAIKKIHEENPNYDETKLAELRYGLEAWYLTFTKLFVIIPLALYLGLFKEMLIMMLVFNILRTTGFGLHATKSWICLLSSTTIFIGLPYIATFLKIPLIIKPILSIISIILIFIYAPADTKKRPLIHKNKRTIYKTISTISCIILNIIAVSIQNKIVYNLIMFGIYTEVVIILPITYQAFHLSYNNYKNYQPIHG